MSVFWLCVCAYLLVSAVGLFEAEIRIKPGAEPSAPHVAWAALCYAMTYPATRAFRWVTAQAGR